MKNEKPVLFNGEMVRAILEGRKTQTRRPMNSRCEPDGVRLNPEGNAEIITESPRGWLYDPIVDQIIKSPFPMPGGALWVRETFAEIETHGVESDYCSVNVYRATEPEWSTDTEGFKWTPSIHMPREASRINLKVKRVWVERIQDISEADCIKESIPSWYRKDLIKPAFGGLWKSCGYEWDNNPFVWCCEFEVVS